MTGFIEYTYSEGHKALLNVNLIGVVMPEGNNARIILNDNEESSIVTLESYDEIRNRLSCALLSAREINGN